PVAPTGNPSLRHMQPGQATFESASRSAARLVLCSPRASIPGAQRDTITTLAAILRITGKSSARASGVCCLESFSAPRARTSPGPIRSRSNRTPAATSGPARHPRPASSAPATNLTPSARSNRNSRRAGRDAGLRRPAARLEEADPVRRPVGEESDTDDPVVRNGAPVSAVLRVRTVVPHHEVLAGRNLDRCPEIAGRSARAALDRVGVLLTHAVANDVP